MTLGSNVVAQLTTSKSVRTWKFATAQHNSINSWAQPPPSHNAKLLLKPWRKHNTPSPQPTRPSATCIYAFPFECSRCFPWQHYSSIWRTRGYSKDVINCPCLWMCACWRLWAHSTYTIYSHTFITLEWEMLCYENQDCATPLWVSTVCKWKILLSSCVHMVYTHAVVWVLRTVSYITKLHLNFHLIATVRQASKNLRCMQRKSAFLCYSRSRF